MNSLHLSHLNKNDADEGHLRDSHVKAKVVTKGKGNVVTKVF